MKTSFSVTKTKLGRAMQLVIAVAVAWALGSTAVSAAQPLLVANGDGNSVLSYQTSPPAFLGTFISSGNLGLISPKSITTGPDGNLYVVGVDASDTNVGRVNRFNGQTGAFINTFATSGSGMFGSTFGPNNKLYVTGTGSNSVIAFDSGGTQSTFVNSGSGGLAGPRGLVFGPDGNLYVASADSDQVLRYNGSTGTFMNVFATGVDARGLVFGPDGNLYVADFSGNRIQKFNGTTGALINSSFASGGGLVGPVGVLFGPDGNLYVDGFTSNNILRYNGTTGAFIDLIGSGNGLNGPRLMAFGPLPAAPALTNIPTLSEYGLVLLACALMVAGMLARRRS